MIPAFDYLRDFHRHRDEYLGACERVLLSGRLILGPEGEAFEREFAAHLGIEHAIGVNSATDALTLALMALGIGSGDEVIVPALTAPATAGAVLAVGARPRFVDVLPDSLTIDVGQVAAAITHRTRCVIPVHLYGRPASLAELMFLTRRRGLRVIEDCAQAHGTRCGDRRAGTLGDIGCFSFYPTKNLGAFGDAGMCVTDDPLLERRLRRLRHYGLESDGVVRMAGRNSRLDELQAALLRAKLPRLDDAVRRRRRLAAEYRSLLAEADLRLPADDPGHAYHQFVVRTPHRARLAAALTAEGIGYGIHYPRPLHLMPAYNAAGLQSGSLPVAEQAADEVLSLPMFPDLKLAEVRQVCMVPLRKKSASRRAALPTTE